MLSLLLFLNRVTLFGFHFFFFPLHSSLSSLSPSLPPSLHLSLHFPCSLVGYNAGSQPALQTDGPLIRCASALPPLPAARFLIKLKPKEEEREGERGREVWEVCSLVLESIICLNRMNDDDVNMKFGRLNHCLSD